MQRIAVIGIVFSVGIALSCYFYFQNKPVETIDELIGQNYDYAHKMYYKTDHSDFYAINVNQELDEFDGALLHKRSILEDSIVHVYTWSFFDRKETIWVGKTERMAYEIVDAVRYSDSILF